MNQRTFMLNRPALQTAGQIFGQQCHAAAATGGGWDTSRSPLAPQRTQNDVVLLAVSELSRAAEACRTGKMDAALPERSSFEVALGNAVIHIFDLAGQNSFDLGSTIADLLKNTQLATEHTPRAWHFPIDSAPVAHASL